MHTFGVLDGVERLKKIAHANMESLPKVLILVTTPILCQILGLASAQQFPEIYDFVIVGGGTAGCAVAARLSQSGNHTVLLLEAGGVPHPDLDIPGTFLASPHYTESLRTYQSVPQEQAALANNGIVKLTIGRVLGGGSAVNGMVFNRGSPFDYDNWARITNDTSWSYGSLLEYFKKSENYAGQFPSNQHGFKGPITVSQPRYAPLLREWLQAGQQLGFSVGDPNGPERVSYAPIEFSKRFGRRVSSYTGYLKPALDRKNLRVITEAEVSQIMFQGRRATGVTFGTKNGTGQVLARKEVIICAGAIESPALLLRSGIGPSEVLKAAQIPQILELPVGQNLQNQVQLPLLFALNKSSIFMPSRDLTPEALRIFNAIGDGPYSTAQGNFAQAFLSSRETTNKGWADVILLFLQVVGTHLQPAQAAAVAHLADWEAPITIAVSVSRPLSRGTVRLDPDDPECRPVVDFQYFSKSKDMLAMIDGIKAALDTFEKTQQFQKVQARYLPVPLEPCQKYRFRSDEYWRCQVEQVSTNTQHPSGTCAMGRGPDDRDTVVDSQLRVLGVEGLRVVDASIMPVTTNANLQAAVYVIAEKASEMILDSWK